MGLLEKTFVVTNEDYDQGFGLDCFRERYSLKVGKQGDTKVFTKWVFPQKYDRNTRENYPGEKAFPMSVELPEDYEDAAIALVQVAAALAKEEDLDFDDIVRKAASTKSKKRGKPGTEKRRKPPRPKWEDDDPGISDDDIPF